MLPVGMETERRRNAIEAVILARHLPKHSDDPNDPLATLRQRARDMLSKVDPELVQWADGDLPIWADPKD